MNPLRRILSVLLLLALAAPSAGQRVVKSAEQRQVETVVRGGLFCARQGFQLRAREGGGLFGRDGREEFGAGYALGVRVAGGYCLAAPAVRPWDFDAEAEGYAADYEPVATEAAFAPLTAALQFSPARPDAGGRQPLCGDALYHYPAAVSPDSAFTADSYYGEKQGWIVWAVTEGRPGAGAAADFVAYRHTLRLSADTAAFALAAPVLVGGRQVLGGVFVVPVVARVGTVEFRLCGIIAPAPGGGWTLCCPFAGEDPPAAPVEGALTPVRGKDSPAAKPDKKKRKKKEKA